RVVPCYHIRQLRFCRFTIFLRSFPLFIGYFCIFTPLFTDLFRLFLSPVRFVHLIPRLPCFHNRQLHFCLFNIFLISFPLFVGYFCIFTKVLTDLFRLFFSAVSFFHLITRVLCFHNRLLLFCLFNIFLISFPLFLGYFFLL